MRGVYADLHRRIAQDGLPPGVAEAVAAAIDGLWLDWVLGLVPLEQVRVVRVRRALEDMLAHAAPARRVPKARVPRVRRSGGRRDESSELDRIFLLLVAVVSVGVGLAAWKYTSIQETVAASANQPEPMELGKTVAFAREVEHRQRYMLIGTVLALRSITLRSALPGTVRYVSLTPGQSSTQAWSRCARCVRRGS